MIPIHRNAAILCAIVLGTGAWLSGCGSDDSSSPAPPGGPTGPFTGTYVDSGGNGGVLSFTIPGAAPVSAVTTMLLAPTAVTGTVQVAGGGTFDLSGSYDPAYGLHLEDVNVAFQFEGTLQAGGHFQGGCCFTPGGSVAWVTPPGDATGVQVLCGSYSRCTDPTCALPAYMGPFNPVVAGATATLAVHSPSEGPVVVPGTVTSSGGQTLLDFTFGQIQATGELLPGGAASGDWADSGGSGDTGIWSATAAQCVTGR